MRRPNVTPPIWITLYLGTTAVAAGHAQTSATSSSEAIHRMARLGWIAGFAIIATVAAAATTNAADNTGRNEHNYTLKLDFGKYVNGIGVRDAVFAISACPQALCFHVSGRASRPSPPGDFDFVSFSLAGLPCDLHFDNIPRKVGRYYMDSPDWRVTLVSRNDSGNGCASLPPDIAGDYNSVVNQ